MYVHEKWAVRRKFSPSGPRYRNGIKSRHSWSLKIVGFQSRRRKLGHSFPLNTAVNIAMPMLTFGDNHQGEVGRLFDCDACTSHLNELPQIYA